MIRAFVQTSPDQYKELDRLRKERRKSLSKLVREAVSSFIKKKEYSVSILSSFLPAVNQDRYKAVTAYFPKHDWDLLEKISKNTGRCKTQLIRKAVKEYLSEGL